MTNNDAPDIPPALIYDEWASRATTIAHYGNRFVACIREKDQTPERDALVLTEIPDTGEVWIEDVGDLARIIALANEVMRSYDDPRAFTREIVGDLRSAASNVKMIADQIDPTDAGVAGIVRARADRIDEFADALESMLPPERP